MEQSNGCGNQLHIPAILLGIVVDASEQQILEAPCGLLCKRLEDDLRSKFPMFSWQLKLLVRHDFPQCRPRDPLEILEFISDLKIEYALDFVLGITAIRLVSRFEQAADAVPSNMLEAGVISISRLLEVEDSQKRLQAMLGLCRHVLGHLWGLEHSNDSVMKPREFWTADLPKDWSQEEIEQISNYLSSIADPRLEETAGAAQTPWKFCLQVLVREGWNIGADILFSRGWLMMLRLGRFTAATAVSVIFLFLSAEAWEMGAAIQSEWLNLVLAAVILGATLSLYFGQNLHTVGRADRMMEQSVRSRIVLIGTLLAGMASFWLNLFIVSLFIIFVLPDAVLLGWAGIKNGGLPILHFAKLMATFGIVASALGGNLEEEHDLKAVLIYTEET